MNPCVNKTCFIKIWSNRKSQSLMKTETEIREHLKFLPFHWLLYQELSKSLHIALIGPNNPWLFQLICFFVLLYNLMHTVNFNIPFTFIPYFFFLKKTTSLSIINVDWLKRIFTYFALKSKATTTEYSVGLILG